MKSIKRGHHVASLFVDNGVTMLLNCTRNTTASRVTASAEVGTSDPNPHSG